MHFVGAIVPTQLCDEARILYSRSLLHQRHQRAAAIGVATCTLAGDMQASLVE